MIGGEGAMGGGGLDAESALLGVAVGVVDCRGCSHDAWPVCCCVLSGALTGGDDEGNMDRQIADDANMAGAAAVADADYAQEHHGDPAGGVAGDSSAPSPPMAALWDSQGIPPRACPYLPLSPDRSESCVPQDPD